MFIHCPARRIRNLCQFVSLNVRDVAMATFTEKVNHKRSEVRTIINLPTISEQSPNVKTHLRLCCLNARSIKSKSADFVCYAASTGANIYTSTETWLTEKYKKNREKGAE